MKINRQKHFFDCQNGCKDSQNNADQNWSYGNVAWKPKSAPRQDVRLNDVKWSLAMTSLLGNSRYQTNRKIYDQSHITLCLVISWKPCTMQIPTHPKTLLWQLGGETRFSWKL